MFLSAVDFHEPFWKYIYNCINTLLIKAFCVIHIGSHNSKITVTIAVIVLNVPTASFLTSLF